MIRNMKKNRIFELADAIQVKEGSVVSQNLARRPDMELALYSFGDGESITTQHSFGDVFYYVIGGKAEFALGETSMTGESGTALLVPHQDPHAVKACGGMQLLYMQVMKKGDDIMYINNFVQNEVVDLASQVEYEKGKIVSKSLVQRDSMTLTLFAFDAGEGVSTHASQGDAMVVVLDGTAEITVDGVTRTASKGQSIIMPAGIPHAVTAVTPYKMLLIVVFPGGK
jgi:quercetin dioxygenase-like cupin family protein